MSSSGLSISVAALEIDWGLVQVVKLYYLSLLYSLASNLDITENVTFLVRDLHFSFGDISLFWSEYAKSK
jgi:hypothetical protein